MQAEKVSAEPIGFEGLGVQIEAWRRTRPRTRSMPEALWIEATAMAQRLGVYRVSHALRLNYDTLKRRVGPRRARRDRNRGATDNAPLTMPRRTDFVEVRGLADVGRAAIGDEMVVEVVACDGARLTIRLRAATANVMALIDAFRGRS